ncbi:MAG TPA: hypothetical protein VFL04_03575 [Rectinemataceae bacterium]|nr:hypothetical protein [Rectinemataceae bacterium]
MSPNEELLADATALVASASEGGLILRLLGGIAVYASCPSSRLPPFARSCGDIDLVSPEPAGRITPLFEALRWVPDAEFNLYNGDSRLCFHKGGKKADVFLGGFRMCHEIPLGGRYGEGPLTLPLAELLLTKLQVFEANSKDLDDASCLLLDHPVRLEDGEAINAAAIAHACSADWGLWRTVSKNLGLLRGRLGEASAEAQERIAHIEETVSAEPKSLGWRMRSLVGDRMRWYELPEEVER